MAKKNLQRMLDKIARGGYKGLSSINQAATRLKLNDAQRQHLVDHYEMVNNPSPAKQISEPASIPLDKLEFPAQRNGTSMQGLLELYQAIHGYSRKEAMPFQKVLDELGWMHRLQRMVAKLPNVGIDG